MATRKRSRKSKPSPWTTFAEALLRPGLIGAVLVLAAVFTLLSLVAGSRGSITGAWVSTLRSFVGVGAWLVPVLAFAIGLALVISALDQAPAPMWRRPAGVLMLFLAVVVAASLRIEPELREGVAAHGEAGGWLGTQIATVLQTSVTNLGAWAFVGLLVIAGIIFLTDRLLIDGAASAAASLSGAGRRRPDPQIQRSPVNPQVPLPQGELPFWKRWRERWAPEALSSQHPEPLPGGDHFVTPVAQPPLAAAAVPASALAAPPAATSSAATRAPAPNLPASQGEVLAPRIVGGVQEWKLPAIADTLSDWERRTDSDAHIRDQGKLIQDTLALFGVPTDFEGAYKGPSVTQYLIKPGYIERNVKGEPQRTKVKVARIASLSNDLALALEATSVRIEAPIPGTNYVGVEVPNRESNVVGLKELMESETFTQTKGRLRIALGEDVKGQAVVSDLARMPHLLIAGATGSGKSVCINSIIACLLLTHTPDTLRLLMIDPKMVELSVYNGVPHLLSSVVTEVDKAAGVLYWAVKEMERRYTLFNKAGARDLARYNEFLTKRSEKTLPMIVVVVDEMADLMMAAPEEVEKHICRLAQMARATGIHLIIATQRPSVDVITGLIKANFPARIAFAVTSQIDSRVILDIPGAERLLGRGDMLFMAPDAGKLERLQGTYLSDDEINKVVHYWKGVRIVDPSAAAWQQEPLPMESPTETKPSGAPASSGLFAAPTAGSAPAGSAPATSQPARTQPAGYAAQGGAMRATSAADQPLFAQIDAMKAIDSRDELFNDAVRVVQEAGRGSISLLQRKLRIGYGRAAQLIDQLEAAGILGPDPGGSEGRPVAGAAPIPQTGLGPQSAPSAPSTPPPTPPAGASSTPRPRIVGDDEDASTPKPSIWM